MALFLAAHQFTEVYGHNRWFVADGQDVNAERVNAYSRVFLYANHFVGVS